MLLAEKIPNRLLLDTQANTGKDRNAEGNAPQAEERILVSMTKSTEHQVEEEATEVSPCTNDPHNLAIIKGIDEGDDSKYGTACMLNEEAGKDHHYDGNL